MKHFLLRLCALWCAFLLPLSWGGSMLLDPYRFAGSGGGGAGITVVDSFVASMGANGGTSAARNTTGANLIVVAVAWYPPVNTATLTDSKGNTYTGRTARSATDDATRIFYCASPVVGTGHTFTIAGTGTYSNIAVLSVSGANASPYEEESGTTFGTQPGSVTPDANGSLIVTSFAKVSGAAPTVTGYTNLTIAESAGVNIAGGMAYKIQTTAAAENPTWSASGATAAAVFKP